MIHEIYDVGIPIMKSYGEKVEVSSVKDKAKKAEHFKKSLVKAHLNTAAHRQRTEDLGGFCFLKHSSNQVVALTAPNASRLIYLSTYMNYDNKLVADNNKPISRKNLHHILKLNKRTTSRFINECVKTGVILEKDNNDLYLSPEFYKGQSQNDDRIKIYKNAVRAIYEKMPVSEHRYFGYIVKLIPYISVRFNIICRNIYEEDVHKVQPLALKEMCNIIDYGADDRSNMCKLRHILEGISFNVGDQKQSLCVFASARINDQRVIRTYINPNVMYVGMHIEDLKLITAVFKCNR